MGISSTWEGTYLTVALRGAPSLCISVLCVRQVEKVRATAVYQCSCTAPTCRLAAWESLNVLPAHITCIAWGRLLGDSFTSVCHEGVFRDVTYEASKL